MDIIQQVLFILTVGLTIYYGRKRILDIRRNILLGRDVEIEPGSRGERWRNLLLLAFGQKKMFKRPIPAVLHLLIYAGFLIINLEVLEFVIDGILGEHRAFAPYLGGAYHWAMNGFEFLAIGVLFSCLAFLFRRNVIRIKRFWSTEMTSWPRLDANIILISEILLMLAILGMNASDQVLQSRLPDHYPRTGDLFFSSMIVSHFEQFETQSLVIIERSAWWFHILGILGFAIYITYSKHLHIFLAFPNTFYSSIHVKGQMNNMPVVTNEVKSMLGIAETPPQEVGRFGAKDINDLPWTSLLAAYACTECGRCTSECPANITGKKLSPRKIMMDTRDRMEDVGAKLTNGKSGFDDGKSLLGNYISKEEINACTNCNACVEACPVSINPLEIILELRRYVAMEESGCPPSWNSMFQNIETNFAPWKFSPTDRFNWAKEKA
ncbi:MAG TPA: (Fe-S)-binding protein [Cyclobacteriaceae bacterium]|nr:(Fe-S)-binding protein [Cyclobacteriaceae bacterium]